MFITLDLEPVTPELTQGVLPDPEGTQGTSAANVSPSQRLVKIRRRKRWNRDDMFSELRCPPTLTKHSRMRGGRQCQSAKKHNMNERRGGGCNRGLKRASGGLKRIGGVRLLTDRRQESMLRLLEHQTDMLQRMVELQEMQQEQRLLLQPLCNQQPSSPSSAASSPRHPRTQCGASGHPVTPPPRIAQASEGWPSISVKVLKYQRNWRPEEREPIAAGRSLP
ncbi:uncharacterized protein LOC128838806 [Malaclemys terrapin pileata]|uniref:uncharacterized protein LOC128838806 n=1 Tax=Malaclemys terrapin pileata TaxID=2991368 RepID=UPI0023A881B7|nr:uncharacterized protein LOC128838806 [Malaclemys terrapin pileata]